MASSSGRTGCSATVAGWVVPDGDGAAGSGWLSGCTDTFDLILVDPPYDSDLLARALPLLAARLAPGGTVYAECRDWPELNGWKRVKEGRAGVVRHGLLMREPA